MALEFDLETFWPESMPALLHARFPEARFHFNSSLRDTVCRFLTADVLVTDGSSLPVFASAFAPPRRPVVLEEARKEAQHGEARFMHFLDPAQSHPMVNGSLVVKQ